MLLGTVKGAGNSSTPKKYSYLDADPLPGDSYYRLSQTDFNGKTEAFSPLAVTCTGSPEFSAGFYPTIIHDGTVFISVSNPPDKKVLVVLSDIYGREVYSSLLIEDKETYLQSIYLGEDISPGLYFITASGNNKYLTRKIVIR